MRQGRITARTLLVAVATALIIGANVVLADDESSASQPASQSVDKSHYTLFDPTPDNLLRDLDTDRPDKTDSPHTIDAGHVQVETGFFDYTFDQDRTGGDDGRDESLGVGQFNFRLGVLNNLELRLIVNSWDFSRATDFHTNQSVRQNGFGDTLVGGKLNIWGDDASDDPWTTGFGIEPMFKIPTAREDLGDGHAELFVGFPFLVNLPHDFGLGLQTSVDWERNAENDGSTTGWENSASVDRVVFDKFDVYLEYWMHASAEHHQETQETIDVGSTYPLNENVSLDTGVNFGLNKASDTIEWTAGITIRR